MPTYVVTTPDGQKYKVSGETDEIAQQAVSELLGSAPAEKTAEGFATRENREAAMPETPELERETAIAERMARRRKGHAGQPEIWDYLPDVLNPTAVGGKDVYLQDYTFGLRDEAVALAGGAANLLRGESPVEGYEVAKEADRRLRKEYAEENPGTAIALSAAGMLTGGLSKDPSKAVTLGQKVLEGGRQAAAQGIVQGAAEGDEGSYGRLGGAAIGGLTAGVIGGAAPLVTAGIKGTTGGIRNTINTALNPEKEAARRVSQAVEKDLANGGDGLDNIAYYKARQSGNPVANVDRGGENVQQLALAASNQSPDALRALRGVVGDRFETQGRRIGETLEKQSKLGGNPEKFMDLADQAAVRANDKLYRDAYSKGSNNIWTPELERLAGTKEVQTALKAAIEKAASRNILDGFGAMNPRVGLDEFGNIAFTGKGGMPAYPDLRLWDLTKRQLDRMGKMAERAGDSDSGMYKGLARKLKEELIGLGDAGQAYAKALQTAASHFGAENAYEAGLKFANAKGMSARDAVKGLSKLKPEERKLFREGYIQSMRDTLKEAPNNRDALLKILNSDGATERARVALGKDGAKQLEAQLTVETAMDALRKTLGNSTTARQLTQLGLASAAGSGGAGLMSGNADPSTLTAGALAGAATRFGKGKLDERLASHIGKILASNDPGKVVLLVKTASQSPKYMEALKAITRALGEDAPALIGREITSQVASP